MSEQFNDRGPFRVGEVCVIVRSERFPELVGRAVTITGPAEQHVDSATGKTVVGHLIDIVHMGGEIVAPEDYLRRRQPPTTGEQRIRALFDTPMVDRRRPVTAWQAQATTAQALMTMGVRVRPGKWPVEGLV